MTPTDDDPSVDGNRPYVGLGSDRPESSETTWRTQAKPSVLLVATLGGGGIHHYVEALNARLGDHVDASIFDMRSNPKGAGLRWLVGSIVASAVAALRFPFLARPDVVHIHASQSLSFYRAAPYVLIASHFWRRPVILHIHGSSFDEFIDEVGWIRRRLLGIVFESTDRIIVLSPYWKQALASHTDPSKLTAIPNAVDDEAYEPTYDNPVPVLTFVSHLTARKGIPELVEAIEELGGRLDQPFEVRIAGTGKLVDAVHALAAKYKQVTYLGYVSEVEKRELLSGSDIFVLPTHAEGLPIALLEGMAGGNAVVTTPVGSIPEVVDDEGALLVESGSVAELTDAMERLITDPERVDMMGRHNRAVVEDRYAWSVVVDHVLATYRTALDDRPMEPSSRGDTERATVEVGPLEAGVGATSTHRQEVHHETD